MSGNRFNDSLDATAATSNRRRRLICNSSLFGLGLSNGDDFERVVPAPANACRAEMPRAAAEASYGLIEAGTRRGQNDRLDESRLRFDDNLPARRHVGIDTAFSASTQMKSQLAPRSGDITRLSRMAASAICSKSAAMGGRPHPIEAQVSDVKQSVSSS